MSSLVYMDLNNKKTVVHVVTSYFHPKAPGFSQARAASRPSRSRHITLCDLLVYISVTISTQLDNKCLKITVLANYKYLLIHTSSEVSVPDRVGPGRAKPYGLALDPMRAGPDHQNCGPTLALLGSGRVGPRANQGRPCPWTVYPHNTLSTRAYAWCLEILARRRFHSCI
jgi:hypothetical protein